MRFFSFQSMFARIGLAAGFGVLLLACGSDTDATFVTSAQALDGSALRAVEGIERVVCEQDSLTVEEAEQVRAAQAQVLAPDPSIRADSDLMFPVTLDSQSWRDIDALNSSARVGRSATSAAHVSNRALLLEAHERGDRARVAAIMSEAAAASTDSSGTP